ncbi:hypothetical protein B0919_14060 [Hymenobacter sp. CRA2]|nr:hypothetical protein B0919_14060 [Hymenobacter sp. CRA2]
MVILAAISLALTSAPAHAQQAPAPLSAPYQAIDARMQQLPDSTARSVDGVARYIKAAFATDDDRAWAALAWTTRHIRYDLDGVSTADFAYEAGEVVQQALSTRVGTPAAYAEVYAALANQLGLKTYVVSGQAQRAAERGGPPFHFWCATRLGGQWYLLDPAWAAGYLANGAFVPQLSSTYFKVAPAEFVRTHLPFDPLWQLLPTPYSPQQFQQGKVPAPLAQPWAVADSVAAYERLSVVGQLRSASRRARQALRTSLTELYLSGNERYEQNYYVTEHNRMLAAYNEAQQHAQQAIAQLNAFLAYYNHQFQPRKTDAQLRQLLAPIGADFQRARTLLSTIQFREETRQATVRELTAAVQSGEARLRKSQAFLTRYLGTAPAQRPVLFTTKDAARNEMLR